MLAATRPATAGMATGAASRRVSRSAIAYAAMTIDSTTPGSSTPSARAVTYSAMKVSSTVRGRRRRSGSSTAGTIAIAYSRGLDARSSGKGTGAKTGTITSTAATTSSTQARPAGIRRGAVSVVGSGRIFPV